MHAKFITLKKFKLFLNAEIVSLLWYFPFLIGVQASLERLQLSYVDIIFVNKADPMCPMEGNIRL